jgi:DNA-binding NarL/FixJ family response regulator
MPIFRESAKQEQQVASDDTGLVLLDYSLKVVAFDRGAAAIMKDQTQPAGSSQAICALPKEILNSIRNCKVPAISSLRMRARFGKHEYSCRACLLQWQNSLSAQPAIAIHLEKVRSSNDAISDVGVKYQLTNREKEVLRGISLGLSSKVMADRMDISPNTVKAFSRLIMIKMGVTTRAGIIANILNRATMDDGAVRTGIASQRHGYGEQHLAKAAASDGFSRSNGSEARWD